MSEPFAYSNVFLGVCKPPIIWATVDLVMPDGTLIERGTYVLQEDGTYEYTPELL